MPVNKVAHHSKHQRKTRPKARFYLLLAEWTSSQLYVLTCLLLS
jgi:hypothetical protein